MDPNNSFSLLQSIVVQNTILSLLWLAGVGIIRIGVVRIIQHRAHLSPESRRRWIVNTRNGLLFLFLAGVAFIWARELQTFALSIVAFAVALAIATKELILCVLGSILRATVGAFSVGDRIEINNMRGDVVDQSMLTTTILEIGSSHTNQYTGRSIVIPNSMLLTFPLANEAFLTDYVPHTVRVPLKADDQWQAAEVALLNAANVECAPFREEARTHMDILKVSHGLEPLSVEPRVSIQLPEPGLMNLSVTMVVPAHMRGQMEQAILRRFLSDFGKDQAVS